MIDIHAHILPGVDDGSQDWEETLQMCKTAVEVGITHMVATPHFIPGAYTRGIKNGPQLLKELKNRLATESIPLEVSLAAEIEPFPEMVQWIEEGRLPLYPSGKHLLVEAPLYTSPSWMKDLLEDLLTLGLVPILAHPERSPIAYTPIPENLVKRGGEIQLDAGSLLGLWGKEAQKRAWVMVGNGWATYVASDSHKAGVRDPKLLRKAREAIAREKGEELALALTEERAKKVVTPWCSSGT
ncbi:MAG: hypothetical protein DRI91_02105 [Aquificota bacterium]|nr:MAG: hypothetical protein DRI91_02105 [Aquificota bacterium]